LQIGDALPAEVLTGQASWEPDAVHLQIAQARLQWQLVAWPSWPRVPIYPGFLRA
jgi:hypothetical protein